MFFFIISLRRLKICCKSSRLRLNAKCTDAEQELCWLSADVELWILKNEKSWKSISSISLSIDVTSASLFSKSNELLKKNFEVAKCDAMNFWSEERFKEDRLCWTDVNKKKTRSWKTYDMTIKVHKRSDSLDQFNKIFMKNHLNLVSEFELVRKIMSIEHDNIVLNDKRSSSHIFLQDRIFFVEIATKNTMTN